MVDPIFIIFQEEAQEHLRGLEQGFLDLEATTDLARRRALIDATFRHAHTLKGDARVIGLAALQESAQQLEDLLERFRDNPGALDEAAINEGLARLDRVRLDYERWQAQWDPATAGSLPGLGPALGELPTPPPAPQPAADELPVPQAAAETSPPPADEDQPTAAAHEAGLPPGGTQPQASPGPAAGSKWSSGGEQRFMVRVPSDQLDRMLNLVGEIQITQRAGAAMVSQVAELRKRLEHLSHDVESGDPTAIDAVYDYVRRIETEHRKQQTREQLLVRSLEAELRQARLLPLTMLAESLRRPVRDLAHALGKKVRYEIDVGTVLLDKGVIEALKTPLLHLISNALDHGLEPLPGRQAAGKPEEGVIRLAAQQRGEQVRIMLSDDGAGLSFERIRHRLRTQLGMPADEVQQLTEQQLAAYLFQPGFTTAEVGQVSGRGVGLDAVRDAVQRLQGRITLASSSSAGTTFVLTVPVTVSTIRILSVWSGGQCYGIPTTAIEHTGRAKVSQVRQLEGASVLPHDGGAVPWVHLAEMIGIGAPRQPGSEQAVPYLMLNTTSGMVAVAIDELEEEREILLKPLGFPLSGMPGVIGGAIRPDGAVQLVLDLADDVFSRRRQRNLQPPPAVQARRVLVVDDSPTTRTFLRNLLAQAGFAVRTAVDGIDALEKLRTHPVDIVVSDFEMPRLGGVDLTRQIKSQYGLPVILVTAREQEHHRRQGLEAGADAYVVKSTFQGEGLIDVLRQFS